jgi:hypothetical protein
MRKILSIVLVASLFCFSTSFGQKQYADYSSRSGFTTPVADSVDVENLVVLAKVWGFVKYHHPAFVDTDYNADYELFELLPQVARADRDERNSVLVKWIECLGEYETAEKTYRKRVARNDYILKADTTWLGDEPLLGAELSERLRELRYAVRLGANRYVQTLQGEMIYFSESTQAPDSNDTGYNLLTLFRLWNMAAYYFPSVGITDQNWSEVLEEYVPKFLYTDSVVWTTAELIAELSDTHSVMQQNPLVTQWRLPVEWHFVEGKLIVTDPLNGLVLGQAPVFEVGDMIVTIDGHTPEYFIERARKYIAVSNESALARNAAELACYIENDTSQADLRPKKAQIVIERNGRRMIFDLTPIDIRVYNLGKREAIESHSYYELLNDSVGYLYPAKYKNADAAAIMTAFHNTKAIVVDMRCYPSDFMPFQFVGQYLVPDVIQHVTFTLAATELPGYYRKAPTSLGRKNDDYYKGMVVVLVDAETQSQAEYTVMALQAAPRTVVVGSQTAGADGNVVQLPLPWGFTTGFSGIGVLYPDGTDTQRVGVRIDHYVEPTIEGIRAGRDELLEKALEIIEQAEISDK